MNNLIEEVEVLDEELGKLIKARKFYSDQLTDIEFDGFFVSDALKEICSSISAIDKQIILMTQSLSGYEPKELA